MYDKISEKLLFKESKDPKSFTWLWFQVHSMNSFDRKENGFFFYRNFGYIASFGILLFTV